MDSYDGKKYLDIRKLRKGCAKRTGFHGTFTKKQETSRHDVRPGAFEQDDEAAMRIACQETRLEDLQQTIPPIAALLNEMVEEHRTRAAGSTELMAEVANELKVWSKTLQEAIDDFDFDSTEDIQKQEGQLQILASLKKQVCVSLELYNEPAQSAVSQVVAKQETECTGTDFIRFSSFSAAPPQQQDGIDDPFAQDPFAQSDTKTEVLDLFNHQPHQRAPSSTSQGIFHHTYAADPFAPNFQQQALVPQQKAQVDPFDKPFNGTSAVVFDPFAPTFQP